MAYLTLTQVIEKLKEIRRQAGGDIPVEFESYEDPDVPRVKVTHICVSNNNTVLIEGDLDEQSN